MQNVTIKKSAVALSLGLGLAMGAMSSHTASAATASYDGYSVASANDASGVTMRPHLYVSPTGATSPRTSVYCFDETRSEPSGADSDTKPTYTKQIGTSNTFTHEADNPRVSGDALNAAVTKVIYNGAPSNAAGIQQKYNLTDDEFYSVTQYAIWYYSDSTGAGTDMTADMTKAYNDLIGTGADALQTPPANDTLDIYDNDGGASQNLLGTEFVDKDTDQPVTPSAPATTPSDSSTPTAPATTPADSTSPSAPATSTTPSAPATTPTQPCDNNSNGSSNGSHGGTTCNTPSAPATTPTKPSAPVTTPTQPSKPTAPATKVVTFRVQYDTTHLRSAAQVKALAKTMDHGAYSYRADVSWNPRTGRVTSAPLWTKGTSTWKIETISITVPASDTPAQIMAAEKAAAAQLNHVNLNEAVTGVVGHTVNAAYLIPAGAWDNTTTWHQGPHTLAQILVGSSSN